MWTVAASLPPTQRQTDRKQQGLPQALLRSPQRPRPVPGRPGAFLMDACLFTARRLFQLSVFRAATGAAASAPATVHAVVVAPLLDCFCRLSVLGPGGLQPSDAPALGRRSVVRQF